MSRLPHIALAGLIFLCGCAAYQTPKPPLSATGDPLIDGRVYIEEGPSKDRVLWQYRTGLEAMRRGYYDEAKRHFDDAIAQIGGILGGSKDARKARRAFNQESDKLFIGEPYERVMAYFYRGILYWMDGEPDNARACFRSGLIVDADTEEKKYSADWVLLEYLDGYVSALLGDDGSDALKRARELSRLDLPEAFDKSNNVFVFAEFGYGPAKYATGEYREQLRVRDGQSRVFAARIKLPGAEERIRPYDDVFYQATTRGGRVMDHVLKNQAVFKKTTDTAGDAALIGGLILAGDKSSREAGLGIAAAGLLSKIISGATTPQADTRTWDNLPQFISFAALDLPPGPHALTVEFLDQGGRLIPSLTKDITLEVKERPRNTVVFVSDR